MGERDTVWQRENVPGSKLRMSVEPGDPDEDRPAVLTLTQGAAMPTRWILVGSVDRDDVS